jgi:hypothetical protein
MIGVDDIVVGDLVLQWAPRPAEHYASPQPPPLNLVLKALSEASGRKFRVSDPEDAQTFLLFKDDDPGRLGPRVVDVVYIGRLLGNGLSKTSIEEKLNELQTRMSSLDERNPDYKSQKQYLSAEADVLKKQLEQANPSDEEINKLLGQISEIVTEAVTKLQPDAKPPEFRFHRGTNLLVVIGPGAAVDITRKVVAALEQAR